MFYCFAWAFSIFVNGIQLGDGGHSDYLLPAYSYLLKDTEFLIYSVPPAGSKVMLWAFLLSMFC
ncbi:hypothetical protein SAMN05444412_11546 [Rhodonellum ikkaensis]|uniref:Uncharacterized protein n=1 Tax=Rhodonellum ikkaensis TaxID=336829 RepID=A0A1H3T449_9BACT|nr:hypothetical protein SAMN05444412_11546 [Rhodonellum ikkaensis]